MAPFIKKSGLPNSQGGPKIQIKLFGQWEETIRILSKLSPEIKQSSIKAQLKLCRDVAKRIKAHLVNQDLNWPPLSSKYLEQKLKKGGDPRTLINNSDYYNAISVWRIGNQNLVMVGVKSGLYSRNLKGRNKIDIARIAAIHEFSRGKRIPRRELWNPTIQEMGGASGIKEAFLKSFVATLRRNGIPVRSFKNLKL